MHRPSFVRRVTHSGKRTHRSAADDQSIAGSQQTAHFVRPTLDSSTPAYKQIPLGSDRLRRRSSAPNIMASTSAGSNRLPKITYSSPGTEEPVYVCAQFTDPPWEPLPMYVQKEKSDTGDLVFYRQYGQLPEGKYQYKFRLGEDWWVVDETAPVVSDDAGNKNNLLTVEKEDIMTLDPATPSKESTKTVPLAVAASISSDSSVDGGVALPKIESEDNDLPVLEEDPPLLPHEQRAESSRDDVIGHAKDDEELLALGETSTDNPMEEDGPPLLPRESLSVVDDAPLLPHESLHEDMPSPLLPHESFSSMQGSPVPPIPHRESRSNSRASRSMSVYAEPPDDVNDPSLEPFPSSREEIFNHIEFTENRLVEDEAITEDSHSDDSPPLAPHSPASSQLDHSAISLPMDSIVEEDASDEDDELSPDPKDHHGSEKLSRAEDQSKDVLSEQIGSANPKASNDAPLTPPLTPAGPSEKAKQGFEKTTSAPQTAVEGNNPSESQTSSDEPASKPDSHLKAEATQEHESIASTQGDQTARDISEEPASEPDSTTPLTREDPAKTDAKKGVFTKLHDFFASLCGLGRDAKGNKGIAAAVSTAIVAAVISAWLYHNGETQNALLPQTTEAERHITEAARHVWHTSTAP